MNLKEMMISQYIDDQLTLEAKALFLEEAAGDPEFFQEALSLVRQEALLRGATDLPFPKGVEPLPDPAPKRRANLHKAALAAAACAVLAVLTLFSAPPPAPETTPHRFVLYSPQASQVALSGSFNGWEAIPMHQPGSSGYWEAVVDLPLGEHRFCYLLDEGARMADPTMPAREQDDFGGVNSILNVEARI